MKPGVRLLIASAWLGAISGTALAQDDLPPLQPARAALPPTFWEVHAWAVILGAAAGILFAIALIVWLRRPRPVVVVPPDVLARRDLEALRDQPEDGVLLMKVSGIFRRYVTFACGLPAGELTATELCQAVFARPQFGSGLAETIAAFLRECDQRKFSPAQPASGFGAVNATLALLEKIEQRRREAAATTTPSAPAQSPPIPKSAAAPPS